MISPIKSLCIKRGNNLVNVTAMIQFFLIILSVASKGLLERLINFFLLFTTAILIVSDSSRSDVVLQWILTIVIILDMAEDRTQAKE